MSVTQKQIAERLGFSQSLVARALKGYPHIAEATQEKVLTTAREMGYHLHSNGDARALVARRHGRDNGQSTSADGGTALLERKEQKATGLIGLVGAAFCHQGRQSSYWMDLAEGVQEVMTRENRRVLLLDSQSSFGWDKVDGALIMERGQETQPNWMPPELPRVSLLNALDDVVSVVADDKGGARLAVEHLLSLGHRRIACMMEMVPPIPSLRLAGYREALCAAEIGPRPEWMRPLQLGTHQNGYIGWGRTTMEEWLRDGWRETGCTALLAQNDGVAVGAIMALQEACRKVPEQVSVVGFDGTGAYDYFSPQLTTVALPFHEIGVTGTDILLSKIWSRKNHEDAEDFERIVLPAEVRIRESTAEMVK